MSARNAMNRGYAGQYNCPSVVLTGPCDPDEVIAFAHEIEAVCGWECEPGEAPDLVIDLAYADAAHGRAAGPELFTEEAIRGQLLYDLSEAASA